MVEVPDRTLVGPRTGSAVVPHGRHLGSRALHAVLFLLLALWMVNSFISTPGFDKRITGPVTPAKKAPFFASTLYHAVF